MLVKTHATGVLYGYVNIHSTLKSEQILCTISLPLNLRIQQEILLHGKLKKFMLNVQKKKQLSIRLSSTFFKTILRGDI